MAKSSDISGFGAARLLRGRVLVVDDSSDNRTLIGRLLQQLGLEAGFASNGYEAVAEIRHGYDLVLLDIQMPGMDGFEVVAHLRKEGIKIPVVAQTAIVAYGGVHHFRSAGFDDYLGKPLSQAKLVDTLARLLPVATIRPKVLEKN